MKTDFTLMIKKLKVKKRLKCSVLCEITKLMKFRQKKKQAKLRKSEMVIGENSFRGEI